MRSILAGLLIAAAAAATKSPVKATPAPPQGSEELRWIKALYPAGKIEGDTVKGVARDGIAGRIRQSNVQRQKVKGGYVIAFLLELEDETREGRYLQVVHVDTKGKYLASADASFPIGGTWEKGVDEGMDSEQELALHSLDAIPGTDRAVLLDYRPPTTVHSSDQYRVFAIGVGDFFLTGEPFGHGTRVSGDASKFTSTYQNIRYEDGEVRASVYQTFELSYENEDDPEHGKPRTEEVTLLVFD